MNEVAGRRAQGVALASVGVDVALVVAKLAAGLLTGSLGLIGEAVHSSLDLASSGFAYFAIRTARKPADLEHPYGHGRAENVAAYTEGVLLLLTAAVIGYEAMVRLLGKPAHVDPAWYAIGLAAGLIVVESIRALILTRTARASGSAALQASATNRIADILTGAAVLAGLAGVRAGLAWADPAAALIVAGVVSYSAARLAWRAGDILIDRASTAAEAELRRVVAAVDGVRAVNRVRTRRSGSRLLGEVSIAARPTLSIEGARPLGEQVRRAAAAALPDLDLTLSMESSPKPDNLVERVHTVAAGQRRIRDLHNVTVEREDDGRLHLSMHAKLPGAMRLGEADAISRDLEVHLRAAIPQLARIDVHLEPLEPDVVAGEDVTVLRTELADRIRSLVSAHPAVAGCPDVELSSRSGRITAHVVAEMSPETSLEEAHAVETELEERVHRVLPEVYEVVARATP